jgi:D-glycero-alpha-D-manno-heptose 1-phosphate guanylyltransferase
VPATIDLAAARAALADTWMLVLAGGLGTRLHSVVADRPKVMALIGGRPFLDILVAQLHHHGVRRIGLLLGHLHEQVQSHVDNVLHVRFPDVEFATSVEPRPLGTGGAVRYAQGRLLPNTANLDIMLMNGDTFVEFDPAAVLAIHRAASAAVTMATTNVPDVSRFGAVEIDHEGRIIEFCEKTARSGPGFINAGVYAMTTTLIDRIAADRAVSLEAEIFPGLLASSQHIHSAPQRGYFVDFGTPASYAEFATYVATSAATVGPTP